jgi:tetratricopeptide (TPR) repeat protein
MSGAWQKARGRNAGRAPSLQPGTVSIEPEARPDSVVSLSHQAKDLYNAREFAAAIPLFREAIDQVRRSPGCDGRAHQGMLGLDLCLLASCLRQTGSTREALAAAEESVEILSAISGPDSFLFRSLETVVQSLEALSERSVDEATAAVRAAEVAARMDRSDPESLAHRFRILNLGANALNRTGQTREALRLRMEAIEVRGLIAEADPPRRHRVAVDYSSAAVLHAKLGEFVEACAAADACGSSMSDPEYTGPAADRRVLAENILALGHRLVASGLRREALRPYVLAIDAFRGLRSDTSRPVEPALAHCLNDHAWNLCMLGEQRKALPFAEEAVDLQRPIAESDVEGRWTLAAYLDTLATALAMADRRTDALAPAREALDIRRGMAGAADEKRKAMLGSSEKRRAMLVSSEILLARIEGRESGSFTER